MGDQRTLQAVADALFPLTEVDKWVLSQSDEDYKLHDWDNLRHIIGVWIRALHVYQDVVMALLIEANMC